MIDETFAEEEPTPLGRGLADPGAIKRGRPSGRAIEEQEAQDLIASRLFGRPRRPATVGRYRVEQRLGSGGSGDVFAAFDPELDRRVAVKLVRGDRFASDDSSARARLVREARGLAKLRHPNVLRVYDVGIHDGIGDAVPGGIYIVMELVDGVTLAQWFRQARRQPREVLDVLLAAGRGLIAAHEAGLTHRDFKPSNVMIERDGTVVVLDFGLVAFRRDEATTLPDPEQTPEGADRLQDATFTVGIVGTPRYMSPEQHFGVRVDARADQWSFCATLYEGLCGRPAFDGRSVQELFTKKLFDHVQWPAGVAIERRVRRAVERGLRSRPEERFESLRELVAALGPRSTRGPATLAVIAGLATAASVGAFVRSAAVDPGCDVHATQMEEVWNSQYRGEIEATFVATGSAAARASFDTVAEAFDRYASAWSEARTAACRTGAALERDHGSEAERDLLRARLECLARKREHFVSLRDVLRTADREVIARAAFRAERLNAELGECSEARVAEESRTELTPARQAQADDILQGMQAAMELAYAGRLDESLDNTRRELERARGSGVASLIVKGLLLEGWIQESRGERASAIASTRDATWLAVEIGDAQHALDGAMDMILWAVEDGDVGVARQWEALARVVLARDGDDDLRWEVEYAGAFVDRLEERFDQALQRARWVWDDFVSRGRPHDSYALATALLLAEVQNLRGDTDDAMQWAQRAERMAMEMFGADHPWVADALHRQAVIHAGLGSPADALELHERALRLRLSVHPELHIKVVESRRDLAGVLRELGRIEEARGQLAKALGSCETILGASHVKCTQIGLALGTLALEQGRPQDAATRAQPPSPAGGTNASRK